MVLGESEKSSILFKQELNAHQMDELCFIIYYPEEKLTLLENESALSMNGGY